MSRPIGEVIRMKKDRRKVQNVSGRLYHRMELFFPAKSPLATLPVVPGSLLFLSKLISLCRLFYYGKGWGEREGNFDCLPKDLKMTKINNRWECSFYSCAENRSFIEEFSMEKREESGWEFGLMTMIGRRECTFVMKEWAREKETEKCCWSDFLIIFWGSFNFFLNVIPDL